MFEDRGFGLRFFNSRFGDKYFSVRSLLREVILGSRVKE